jgi:hypothetical protein
MKYCMWSAALLLGMVAGCAGENVEPVGLDALAEVELLVTAEFGVELGDTNYVFGNAVDVVRTDSLVYVLDMARARIALYDDDGLFAGSISRRGSGPGELASPRGLLMPPGGLLVQDINGLKLLTRDGSWERLILEHHGNWARQNVLVDDSTFCVVWHNFEMEPDPFIRPFVGVYGFDGEQICELWADSIRIPVPPERNNYALNSFMFGHYLAADGKGNIFHHRRHTGEYLISRYDRNGSLIGEYRRDIAPVARTEEEMRLEKEYIEDMLRGGGTSNVMQWVYDPAPFREPVSGIWTCGDGYLWVLLGTEDLPTFDVWSVQESELLYSAVLPLEVPPGDFLTFHIDPHCRDFAAVYEDAGMVQRVLLINRIDP